MGAGRFLFMSQSQTFRVAKINEDERLVFGFASVAVRADGESVVDAHGDEIPPMELERAAYDYVLRSREGGDMHERMGVARIVESCVFTPEKLQKLGLPADSLPNGWWIGFRVDDADVWARVKSGELKAFSIGGRARRVENGDS